MNIQVLFSYIVGGVGLILSIINTYYLHFRGAKLTLATVVFEEIYEAEGKVFEAVRKNDEILGRELQLNGYIIFYFFIMNIGNRRGFCRIDKIFLEANNKRINILENWADEKERFISLDPISIIKIDGAKLTLAISKGERVPTLEEKPRLIVQGKWWTHKGKEKTLRLNSHVIYSFKNSD